MYEGLTRYFRALSVVCLLALSACPATVPPPSSRIDSEPASLAPGRMHDIAPEVKFSSYLPHFADLNGDGKLDMLVGSKKSNSAFRVEWGDGLGHWRSQAGPASNIQPRAMAVGDVNKDGHPEILIGGEGEQHGLQIWDLDAKGAWKLYSKSVGEGIVHGVALKDINGDGWPDVVVASMGTETPGGVRAWINNRKGGWIQGFGPTDKGHYTGLAVADVNGDGYQDIVASARGGFGALRARGNRYQEVGGVQIWLGDGNGHWDSRLLPVKGDAESVCVADVNGDGKPDILAGLYRIGVRMWLNTGKGWDEETITDKGSWGDVRVADIDGDGKPEIIAASRDGQGLAVWRWSKGGFLSFSHHAERVEGLLPSHGVYFGIDTGDVFGDGHVQVAAAREDGRVEVWSERRPAALPPGEKLTLPKNAKVPDLYHVTENKVFKTVNGVVEYRVGAGDELTVTMWQGDKPTSYKLMVQADGTISMPYFPGAKVDGMTAPEIDTYLTKALSRYLRHPRIDVLVTAMHSKKVRVFGLGSSPLSNPAGIQSNPTGGTIYLTGRETLVDLLSSLGAPAKDADFSRIRLVRNGTTTVLDVNRAIRHSDNTQNAVLDDGDTVVIPSLNESAHQVYVLGEVNKPGVVTFHGKFRFLDAVSKSGGFTRAAYYPDIRIIRADREVPEIYAISFDRLLKQGDLSQNMVLKDKDIIIIPADPITNWNRFIRKMLPTVGTISSTIAQVNTLRTLLRNSANSNVLINAGTTF